jgi:tryptophan synthase alpha chain
MNRIGKAFENKKAFITFTIGGDPDIETTERLVLAMDEAGAGMIEIGIPFSDPIAEGPVIQAAAQRALAGGCTTDQLFDLVSRLRSKTEIPLLFMTYINPVFVYGTERFLGKCRACGIDGVIIPDLPFEEKEEIEDLCLANDIALISLISPASGERIAMIAREAKGFLYCVSSFGVTGMRTEFNTDLGEMVKKAKEVTPVPCAVGFGIATPEQAREIASLADGVIVGSAIVDLVARYGRDCAPYVKEFVTKMIEAMDNQN